MEGIGFAKNFEGYGLGKQSEGWGWLMSEHKNIILQFSANWCNPCQQAKRYIKSIQAEDNIFCIDVEENKTLASEYKIENIPTFINLDIDGKEVSRFVGFDKNKIDEMLLKI